MILLLLQRSIKSIRNLLTVCILISLNTTSFADNVIFKNGDKLSGEILSDDGNNVVLSSEALGELSLEKEFIEKIEKDGKEPLQEELVSMPETVWTRKVSLGYDISQGNTETESISAGFTLGKKREKVDELSASATASYSSSKKKMNAQKWKTMGRYAVSFGKSKKWYDFFKLEVDHDKFANIYYRTIPNSGIGYWFFDEEDIKLMAEAAAGLEYTNFEENTKSLSRGVLVPRVFFEKKLWFNSKITQNVYMYPVIQDLKNYRLVSKTDLSSNILEGVTLVASLIDEYNSKPSGDAKKNDLQMRTSVVYLF